MHMGMKKLLALCSFMLLAACATPEQIAYQRQMQEQADFNTCAGYGLRPGSEAFGMCRLELDLARQRRYDYYQDRYYTPRFGVGYHYLRR